MEVHGEEVEGQNPNVWKAGDAIRELDVIVLYGFGWKQREIAEFYRERGVVVLVLEQGHTARPDFWQFGIDRLNWLPEVAPSSDRRSAIGIEQPKKQTVRGGYVLVLGQKPGDAQHTLEDMNVWRQETLTTLRSSTKKKLVWRRHPKDAKEHGVTGFDLLQHPLDCSLEKSFEGASCCVTHNSNAGLKAIMQGIPVFCAPECFYAPVALTEFNFSVQNIQIPKEEIFEDFFDRLCYAQWTAEEFNQGLPWEFMKPFVEKEWEANASLRFDTDAQETRGFFEEIDPDGD